MTWRFSTGLQKALLASKTEADILFINDGISTEVGTGTGGRDRILAASGLDAFSVHDFITFFSGDANNGACVKVLTVSATTIEVATGDLAAVASGSDVGIAKLDISGSFATIFRNCTVRGFNALRPSSADDAEPASPSIHFTLNGNPFTAGASENGLNMELTGTELKRAVDPETGSTEDWTGDPSIEGTLQSVCVYANDVITGASTTSIRMWGTVGSGADFRVDNTTLTIGNHVRVTDVSLTTRGA